jgi:hypothetical protein
VKFPPTCRRLAIPGSLVIRRICFVLGSAGAMLKEPSTLISWGRKNGAMGSVKYITPLMGKYVTTRDPTWVKAPNPTASRNCCVLGLGDAVPLRWAYAMISWPRNAVQSLWKIFWVHSYESPLPGTPKFQEHVPSSQSSTDIVTSREPQAAKPCVQPNVRALQNAGNYHHAGKKNHAGMHEE